MHYKDIKSTSRKICFSEAEETAFIYDVMSVKYGYSKTKIQSISLVTDAPDEISENILPLSDRNMRLNVSHMNLEKIYRILSDVSDENSSVSYAPLLYPITAYLLNYLPESEVKACVSVIVNDKEIVPASKVEWNRFCQSYKYIWSKYAKKSYKHFGNNLESCFYWPYVIWNLPQQYQDRVLLSTIVEGNKVLYRLMITLCRDAYKMQLSPDETIKNGVLKAAQTVEDRYTPHGLLLKMFGIRNFSRIAIKKSQNQLESFSPPGDWIIPTTERLYIAYKQSDSNPSQILTPSELMEIIKCLPPNLRQTHKPMSLFDTGKDGYSLASLYHSAEEVAQTILIVESAKGEVFGAFTTSNWTLIDRSNLNLFFGKGDCFVFQIRPTPFSVYRWSGDKNNVINQMFQKATHDQLEVGGGKSGSAIKIDKNINKGSSSATGTFNNPCLTPFSNDEFLIKRLELLQFEEV